MFPGALFDGGGVRIGLFRRRPHSSVFNPLGEVGDLASGQLAPERHLGAFVPQRPQQHASIRIARDDRGTAPAARERRFPRIEAKPRLLYFRAVAAPALFRQNRPHSGLKESGILI